MASVLYCLVRARSQRPRSAAFSRLDRHSRVRKVDAQDEYAMSFDEPEIGEDEADEIEMPTPSVGTRARRISLDDDEDEEDGGPMSLRAQANRASTADWD